LIYTCGDLPLRLKYDGYFEVPRSRFYVFQFLRDPLRFARVLPGFKEVEVIGVHEFKVYLTLNVGPLRGDVVVVGRLVEVEEPKYIKVVGRGEGVNSTLDFTLIFAVDEVNTGSRVSWVFEGTVGGLAALMGRRVLDGIARILINDIVSCLREALQSN